MTRLLIAEKPSVARDIAKVIGASRQRGGYLEGPGWVVTWCIGHLVELVEPHEYDPEWKRWSLGSLPMLPPEFRLRPVQNTAQQFEVVKGLLQRDFVEVVNGCDAGREGELIFRYVYQLARAKLPIRRLWISSMTEEAIQEGLASLRPGPDYQRLFDAARCRSEADWLVGLNATRAITVRSRIGKPFDKNAPLYSVGRVQTPTLALIVDREKEVTDFKPKDYWQLVATFENPKGTWTGRWFRTEKNRAGVGHASDVPGRRDGGPDGRPGDASGRPGADGREGAGRDGGKNTKDDAKDRGDIVDRFDRESDALAIRDKVLGRDGRVIEVEQKRTKEPPPMLFDLTRLQRTANKRYGFSAAHTLEVAQALYEKHKLLTYPRTDSTHLGSDMVPRLKASITALRVQPYLPYADRLLQLEKLPISKRFVDDKKVSDHHAIIPTPNKPKLEALNLDERRIYDLVVRRFLGVFFPDAIFDRTKVITEVEGETFITRGKVMIDGGWREVAGYKDDEPQKKKASKEEGDTEGEGDDDEDQGALPPLAKGDPAHCRDADLQKKQTQPPPRFTEASLLAAMEGAGRLIEEEELQQAMKDTGLGTPATRASIIETLINRQYIFRKGKTLMPTEKGIRLIDAIPVESLRSPQLTGEWEARLARMARGEYPADGFMREVRGYIQDVVDRIKRSRPIEFVAAEQLPASDPKEEAAKGDGAKGRGRDGKAAKAGEKPAGKSGAGKPSRTSKADGDGKKKGSKKEARPDDPEGTIGRCPRCNGAVIERPDAFTCAADGRGCGFALRKQIAARDLTAAMVKKLLEKGRTQVLKGFVSPKSGVKFDAALLLKPEGGIGFEFHNRPEEGAAPEPPRAKPAAKPSPARPSPPTVPDTAPDQAAPLGACPLCGHGQVIAGKKAWGCGRWKDGCRFVLPFEVGGRRLTDGQARQLLERGRLGPLGLIDETGARFDGEVALLLDRRTNQSQVRVRRSGAEG